MLSALFLFNALLNHILMKYSDFVKRVAIEAGVSQRVAKASLDASLQVIKDTVKANDEVVLNGVGKFVRKVRPARTGINPATKEKVEIPETASVSFKVSKEFRDHLNG